LHTGFVWRVRRSDAAHGDACHLSPRKAWGTLAGIPLDRFRAHANDRRLVFEIDKAFENAWCIFEGFDCPQDVVASVASVLPTTAAQLYTDFNPTRVGSLLYKIYQQDNIQSSPPTFSSGVGAYPANPSSGC